MRFQMTSVSYLYQKSKILFVKFPANIFHLFFLTGGHKNENASEFARLERDTWFFLPTPQGRENLNLFYGQMVKFV